MKKYIYSSNGSKVYTYKGITIYKDSTNSAYYIYTGKHGTGKVEFPSDSEAEQYIDSLKED